MPNGRLSLARLGDFIEGFPWHRGMSVVLFLSVTGFAYACARLTLTLVAPSEARPISMAFPHPVPSLGADAIERLAHMDPLSPTAPPPPPAPSPHPSMPLPLVLKGTSTAGYAILTVKGKEGLYRRGSEVVPGIRIEAVYRDRVVLLKEGEEATLWLEEKAQRKRMGSSIALGREGLEKLVRSIELEPRRGGLQVTRLAKGSQISRLGLAEGDVIQAVNGHPVTSLQDLAGLYMKHQQMRRIKLDILRGERPASLELTVQ